MFTEQEIIATKYDGHAGNDAGDSIGRDGLGRRTTLARFPLLPPSGAFGPDFQQVCRERLERLAFTALARLLHYLSQEHDNRPHVFILSQRADMESKLSVLPYGDESCDYDRRTAVITGLSNQELRIRAVLKIPSGPLPEVSVQRLRIYYAYLAIHLQFPFEAHYAGDEIRLQRAPLCPIVLLDPAATPHLESWGLICRAAQGEEVVDVPLVDLEVEADHPNCQFIEDYWYWFWNWRFDPKI